MRITYGFYAELLVIALVANAEEPLVQRDIANLNKKIPGSSRPFVAFSKDEENKADFLVDGKREIIEFPRPSRPLRIKIYF